MQNEIIISSTAGETRVAILERGVFVELHIERPHLRSIVGSVIKGRVTRVLPGMQAAFVDIGVAKAAFLYAGDYVAERPPDAAEKGVGEEPARGRRARRRNGTDAASVPKIESLLREGQEILVQVAKEPIGTKGARITSHIAIPGRHLVLTPWSRHVGVSRRIESDRERKRLRQIVERLRPRELGFIIRTAGEGAREADLEADIKYLTSVWDEIQQRKDQVPAPTRLYEEPTLPLRVLRDFANAETRRIVVDDPKIHAEIKSFASRFMAEPRPRIERYRGQEPVFDHFGLEQQIEANLGRKVWLKSGGYLVVDQSEALTAIDVNTGRFVGKRDLEDTVLKTNLEAVREIVHQLRFRNIGGLIIIDLIDMESAENREKVYRALQEELRHDKAKTNILKISELGLVEMTRKRTRENLVQRLCEPCSHCEGRGYMLSRESVTYKILRELRKDLPRFAGRRIALTVNPRVGELLLGRERQALADLERELGRSIEVRTRAGMHQEQFELAALEGASEPVALELSWLAPRRGSEAVAAREPRSERGAATEAEPAEGGQAVAAQEPPGSARPEQPEAEEQRDASASEEPADLGLAVGGLGEPPAGPDPAPSPVAEEVPSPPSATSAARADPAPEREEAGGALAGRAPTGAAARSEPTVEPVDEEAEFRILPPSAEGEER